MKDVETKIIALIHGEISGNEAIELLELIESDKTIKAQYEAQLQINQLAHEAASSEDEAWQMEKSRRKSLLETLSGEAETSVEKVEVQAPVSFKSPQPYKIEWRAVSGIAACVAGTVLVAGIMFEDEMKFEQYVQMDKSAERLVAYSSEEKVEITGGASFEGKRSEQIEKPQVRTSVKKKPSSPSSSSAPVIVSRANSPMVLPTPEVQYGEPPSDLGNVEGFGDGFGRGDAFGEGGETLSLSNGRVGGLKEDLTRLVDKSSLSVDPDQDGFSFRRNSTESLKDKKAAYAYWVGDESKKEGLEFFPKNIPAKEQTLKGYGSMSYEQKLALAKKSLKAESGLQGRNGVVQNGKRREKNEEELSLADIAKFETLRRQEVVKSADSQLAAATKANKSGEYKESVDLLEKALESLPQGKILDGRRSRMQQEYGDASIALGKDLMRKGDVAGAREALTKVLKINPRNKPAEEELDKLYDPIRNNSAASKKYTAKVDEVKRALYKGEGFYNLGLYDEAHAEFDKVLRADPYNQASRRWQARIHNEKRDYYRSAYDETRARLLTEVDRAWEVVPVPELSKRGAVSSDLSPKTKRSDVKIEGKLGDIESIDSKSKGGDLKPLKKSKKKQVIAKTVQTHDIKNLNDEVSAKVEPTSTFSLHVSDVSFKLAKSAMLDKGTMPDHNKIRPEEFVNAFDYGDPSVKGGAKVACHMEQVVHPFMQQRNLMRVSMSTAALGRSTPLRLTILLDNSGSMEREDREASVLKAMEVLVSQLQPHDEVSLISFSQTPRIIAEGLKGNQLKKLVQLVKQAPSEGGTNMEKALKIAGDVAKRTQKKGMQSRIVLMTDGAANLGNAEPEDLSKMVVALRQKGIAFDACGVGADKLDDTVLEALARKGDGRYYLLDKPEDADGGFAKQLAGALRPAASNVKVQVVFNPSRVMHYKLLGFEKHLLKKEDFRNDKVDAAEMAAQEAGSAIYQFQPFAGGKGDVGKVFVRFRDMNTGHMVERSWTIPYISQPQTIEKAKPSIQLATTAAMLAEKIRNTDVGLVDFSEYGKVLGDLNQAYSNDQRVKDLIRMVEKVRR